MNRLDWENWLVWFGLGKNYNSNYLMAFALLLCYHLFSISLVQREFSCDGFRGAMFCRVVHHFGPD